MRLSDYPHSIHDALAGFRAGSLKGSELLAATAERIRALDPLLNAYIEAYLPLRADRLAGPLGGIPIAVKDMIDLAGRRTTAGSAFRDDHVADEDAAVIGKLRAAGAVFTGKTNLHEWALGVTTINPHFGACRNPWDTAHIAGGSSGGSAAAVAAGLCLGAIGTDTGGSIRIPAALCGIVGLKPTFGRVSLRGVVPLSWSLDHVGPMARTVRDAALLLGVMAGHDPLDPVSVDQPAPDYVSELDRSPDVRGLRIGVAEPFFFDESQAPVVAAAQAAVLVLRDLGATTFAIDLHEAADMGRATGVILFSDASAYHRERLGAHPEKFGADVRERLRLGLEMVVDYPQARQTQRAWRRRLREVFQSVDAILTPATPVVAASVDDSSQASTARPMLTLFSRPFNLSGTPALTLPCGFAHTPEGRRLPIGLQLVGRWWDEATLLRIANAYERATDWHRHRPPLPSIGT